AGNLDNSREFYSKTLGLKEIGRPKALADKMKGAWYQVGSCTLHLIVEGESEQSTFRTGAKGQGKPLSSRDIHFALRISNYVETLQFLFHHGYREGGEDELGIKVSYKADAGFPQIFIMDPNRNVIELNAARLLNEGEVEQVERALAAQKGTAG
ncbi:MAG TPA: hypothetical protein VK689_20580, partial [Armatimonadota bacterium]|nr:hypothetical protein [Armatimonadota bacterium]